MPSLCTKSVHKYGRRKPTNKFEILFAMKTVSFHQRTDRHTHQHNFLRLEIFQILKVIRKGIFFNQTAAAFVSRVVKIWKFKELHFQNEKLYGTKSL